MWPLSLVCPLLKHETGQAVCHRSWEAQAEKWILLDGRLSPANQAAPPLTTTDATDALSPPKLYSYPRGWLDAGAQQDANVTSHSQSGKKCKAGLEVLFPHFFVEDFGRASPSSPIKYHFYIVKLTLQYSQFLLRRNTPQKHSSNTFINIFSEGLNVLPLLTTLFAFCPIT